MRDWGQPMKDITAEEGPISLKFDGQGGKVSITVTQAGTLLTSNDSYTMVLSVEHIKNLAFVLHNFFIDYTHQALPGLRKK